MITQFMHDSDSSNPAHRVALSWIFRILLIGAVFFSRFALAQEWTFWGPEGGDARRLAFDPQNPNRILLGTNAGALFASDDGGQSWSFRAQIGSNQDYVLDDIAFDPHNC